MFENLLLNCRLQTLLFLGMMLLFPLTQVSAEVVWEEDFNSGISEKLTFFAWTSDNGIFRTNTTAQPTVENAALQMPNNRVASTWSGAQRNTTLAYGSWSFDYTVKEGEDHTSCDTIFFVSNFPWDLDGRPLLPSNLNAYYIAIKSGSTDNCWPDEPDHGLNFGRIYQGNAVNLVKYVFPADLVGSYNIDILRKPNGEFNIYWDSELIINKTDILVTSAEVFVVGSWTGDSTFDNFVVEEFTDTTSDGLPTDSDSSTSADDPSTTDSSSDFNVDLLFLALIAVMVVTKKRK